MCGKLMSNDKKKALPARAATLTLVRPIPFNARQRLASKPTFADGISISRDNGGVKLIKRPSSRLNRRIIDQLAPFFAAFPVTMPGRAFLCRNKSRRKGLFLCRTEPNAPCQMNDAPGLTPTYASTGAIIQRRSSNGVKTRFSPRRPGSRQRGPRKNTTATAKGIKDGERHARLFRHRYFVFDAGRCRQ